MDAQTGEVLYARNPDERLLPASTTKLMTALIVYEKLGGSTAASPSRKTTGPSRATSRSFPAKRFPSTSSSTRCSSNRPTTRPARSGATWREATEAFVDMMNQRALAMGCFNTHFTIPTACPRPPAPTYTSCADLMRIFQRRHRLSRIAPEFCSTKEYVHQHRLRDAHPPQP